MRGNWRHCAGLEHCYFEADGDCWFVPRMVFQLFNRQESLKERIGLPKQNPSEPLRAMAFNEVCPERLLDPPFDWEEPQHEGTDPRLISPGGHGTLATPVMDPRTLGDVQGMSVAPRWDGSGTTAIKCVCGFLCLGARLDVQVDRCHEKSCLALSDSRLPVQPTQGIGTNPSTKNC